MRASKVVIKLALVGLVGVLTFAVLPAFGSPERLHFNTQEDGSSTFSDGATVVTLGNAAGCELTLDDPSLIAFDATSTNRRTAVGWNEGIGVKAGGSNGSPCGLTEASDAERLIITSGNEFDWNKMELDLDLKQSAVVEITVSGGGYGADGSETFTLLSGASIAEFGPAYPGYTRGTTDFPYTVTVTGGPTGVPVASCANPSDSGPDNGPNDNCRLVVVPGTAFDRVEITSPVGAVALEGGADFYGTYGPDNETFDNTTGSYDTIFHYAPSVTANDDSYELFEDNSATDPGATTSAFSVAAPGVLANDAAADGTTGATLSATMVPGSLSATPWTTSGTTDVGSLTLHPDGSFSYTPAQDFNGVVTFAYALTDDQGSSPATPTVTLTVQPVNDTPHLTSPVFDQAITDEDTPLAICPGDVGSDIEGDSLYVVTVVDPGHGTVDGPDEDGCITYQPDPDFDQDDSFAYALCEDDRLTCSPTQPLTVHVTPVNDPPVATDDTASVHENNVSVDGVTPSVTIDVLANDTDVDNVDPSDGSLDPVELGVVAVGAYAGDGTLTLNADSTITYRPAEGFFGTETFSYTVSDPDGATDAATVTVDVVEVMCTDETRSSRDGSTYGAFTLLTESACKSYTVAASASDDQVTFIPEGTATVYFTGVLEFNAQDVATGAFETADDDNTLSLLVYDPDGDGVDFRPMPVCVSPTFGPVIRGEDGTMELGVTGATIPGTDTWCLALVTATADDAGNLAPRYLVYGIGDPLFRAR